MNTPQSRHARYTEQASWSAPLRRYLLQQTGLEKSSTVLDVGCGTGAVMRSLQKDAGLHCLGVDISLPDVNFLYANFPALPVVNADAYQLPIVSNHLDACLCHYFLLWLQKPMDALHEMVRVIRPGGWLLAFAEPDYGGRIDHPEALAEPGILQAHALHQQGANPETGRHLPEWFSQLGLVQISCGVMGAEWHPGEVQNTMTSETSILEHDLDNLVPASTINNWKGLDQTARMLGSRVVFVPTFWAIGKKAG